MATGGYYTSESDDLYYPGGSENRVHRLTSNLQDTTKNLRTLDRMLGSFREVGREQRSAIDRLRDDVGKTAEEIHYEKRRGARNYRDADLDVSLSDDEHGRSPGRRQKSKKNAVRFADDMNRELHEIHRNVRDLSSDQIKLEETLDKEIERRDRSDVETKRNVKEIAENLRKMPQHDPIATRVERRLQQIQSELRMDRHHVDRNDELSSLSSDLKQALHQHQAAVHQPQQSYLEQKLQSQYMEAEAQKHKIEGNLEDIRRKLDQSEGSRTALQNQIEDLRSQLTRTEQEKSRFRTQMDEAKLEEEIRERRKKKAFEEEKERKFEKEMIELKSQLARSVGAVNEVEELRRGMDKSERQRAQLSDHIEVLTKDLENREKQTAKLITQLKDVSDKYDEADRYKGRIQTELDETAEKLKSTSRELERTNTELRNTQMSLHENEKKKDEFKGRAQETVRQWKMKVKQLEREVDRSKHGASQVVSRNEQLIKEIEDIRHQGNNHSMQIENLRRELGETLALRAAQDEQLRLKDIENNELKSYRMDLERELRDSRTVIDRLENDLSTAQARVGSLTEDRNRLDSKLSSVESAHLLSQDQANQLQHELKDLSSMKAEMGAQLSEANSKIHELRNSLVEFQHRDKNAKEENGIYKRQLFEERETHKMTVEALKREVQEAKLKENQVSSDLSRRLKRMQAETEASLEALKLELSEDKSALKIARRNEEKYKTDVEKLLREIQKYEEDNTKLLRKVEKLKQHFHTQVQLAEDDGSRVKTLEEQIIEAQCETQKLDRLFESVMKEMNCEVNAVTDIAVTDSIEKFQALNGLNGTPSGTNFLVADTRHKLKWLRSELRERVKRERKLRQELRDTLRNSDSDRQYLLSELSKRDGELDELTTMKQELAFKEIQNTSAVEDLEEKILDLSDEIHMQKLKKKQHAVDDVEDFKDTLKEREKIEQRYSRLQDTMKSLQEELKTVKLVAQKTNVRSRNSSPYRTPSVSPKRCQSPARSRSRSRSMSPRQRKHVPINDNWVDSKEKPKSRHIYISA